MNESFFNRLAKDAVTEEYFLSLFSKLSIQYAYNLFSNNHSIELSEKEFYDLLRFADIFACTTEPIFRNKALRIISLLNEPYKDDQIYQKFSQAIYAKLGNFISTKFINTSSPALSSTQHPVDEQAAENETIKKITLPFERAIQGNVKENIQTVPFKEGFVFTDVQYELYKQITTSKTFSFSGVKGAMKCQ